MKNILPIRKHKDPAIEAEFLCLYKILSSIIAKQKALEERIEELENTNASMMNTKIIILVLVIFSISSLRY